MPIFYSSGDTADIATPDLITRVAGEMRGAGFNDVGMDTFEGAHVIHQPHIRAARQWFAETAAR